MQRTFLHKSRISILDLHPQLKKETHILHIIILQRHDLLPPYFLQLLPRKDKPTVIRIATPLGAILLLEALDRGDEFDVVHGGGDGAGGGLDEDGLEGAGVWVCGCWLFLGGWGGSSGVDDC